MNPKQVDIKPYKLVIYGPGDHFTWHKDTPEKGLCGTLLVCLFDNCDGAFEMTPNMTGRTQKWDTKKNCCAFYPDTPHRVTKIKTGYRVVLTFKVFQKGRSTDYRTKFTQSTKESVDKIIGTVRELGSVGILLKHQYGYNSKSIYGHDLTLLQSCKEAGLKLNLKPVLVSLD
jgi:2OG-Fe(II) oxygenase superfamily